MPFRLCNALATFQRCKIAIFHELIEDSMLLPMVHKRFLSSRTPDDPTPRKRCPFNFFKECIQDFDKLKQELTQAPIMIKPDWSLLFEIMCDASDYVEFDIGIHDKKGVENLVADHLSRLENIDLGKLTRAEIQDLFLEEQLMTISDKNQIIRRCVAGNEAAQILQQCHSGPSGGHHGIATTARKVEAHAFPASDARNVINFLKRLFARFGIPKPLISDRGTHFCNYQMERAMKRYEVVYRFSTAYHPQINSQVKNTNRAIQRILEKTIRNNRKEWSHKLDDALLAFRTVFKTLLGTNSFRIIYGNAWYLPVEREYKAYLVLKTYNMDITKVKAKRFLQSNELDELRLTTYESSISYKERTKRWYDKQIKTPTNYEKGDKVVSLNFIKSNKNVIGLIKSN
ncbi:reverse transcriptase domain-containing protein [Tanacetum coccineum]